MSSSSNATTITSQNSDLTGTNKRRKSNDDVHHAYKGVILQQNSRWGAQIYLKSKRIWLGTFKSEKEAAMVYDSASLKLKNNKCDRNFPWTNLIIRESYFQRRFTADTILKMIRDGSYPSRLANYLNTEQDFDFAPQQPRSGGGYLRQRLFRKELTPSDVGRLKRLVIPKKDALKFFPSVPTDEGAKAVELSFHDRSMSIWKFRYCYWKSSQSFVFTCGWNRFVNVNSLRSRDVITFWLCKGPDDEASLVHLIEVTHKNQGQNGNFVAVGVVDNVVEGLNNVDHEEDGDPMVLNELSGVEGSNINLLNGEEEMGGDQDQDQEESVEERKKGFRLFGMQIL